LTNSIIIVIIGASVLGSDLKQLEESMSFFGKLAPVSQGETMESLMLAAETLHHAAISGNERAVAEIERGLKDLSHWDLAGLIEKDGSGHYTLRSKEQPVMSSGPIGLGDKTVHITRYWKQ
jgi:hypothetical protein